MHTNNEGINLILSRRSYRYFLPDLPAREDLETIVETGRYAPSGMNRQLCHFLVVTNQDVLAKLTAIVSSKEAFFANHDFRYEAPAMVIVCHRKDCTVALQDAACAMENMMIAATALGVGSRWVNQLWRLSDEPEIRQLLSPYGYTEDEFICASLILGIPTDPMPPEKPRTGNKVTWVE